VRRLYLALIAVAIVVFLAVSALLARVFSADGAERSAITSLIAAEARGDQAGMLDRIQGCRASSACRARVADDLATLKHGGSVSILQLQSSTGFSLSGTIGLARVAWNAGGSLPIVQCVQVRRAGDAISGLRIELLAISVKLNGNASCPARLYQ
jgi:hypothetical protein